MCHKPYLLLFLAKLCTSTLSDQQPAALDKPQQRRLRERQQLWQQLRHAVLWQQHQHGLPGWWQQRHMHGLLGECRTA